MAWDKTLPTGSTALSASDDMIRDNWTAIETGTVPYDALKLQTQAGAPGNAADYGFLYGKDVGGKVELHYEDEDANEVVLSSAGSMGSDATDIIGSELDIDNININGNTIISTDVNGDINLTPNGTGSVVISKGTLSSGAVTAATGTITTLGSTTGTITTLGTTNLTAGGVAYPTADGNANDVLQTNGAGVASFVAFSAVGGASYVSTTTISNDATIDFTGLNEAGTTYMFLLENVVPVTDNVNLYLRMSTDNGSSFDAGANYEYAYVSRISTSTGGGGNGAETAIVMAPGIGSDAGEAIGGIVTVIFPQNTNAKKTVVFDLFFDSGSGDYGYTGGGGHYENATDVDAVRFLFSSGNLESGTITLYKLAGS